uniref:Uncharacterized protein n=1 Tax=Phlebotomus papatasi TaxID=29031 RepID=A0A1B0DJM3_PHLPP
RALSKASKDRTCIVITHKLSSVRHADLICVIDRGVITEIGTHSDLVSYGGTYSKLKENQKEKVHGRSIFDFSLYDLRSQFGYVSQEPILFDYTIAENIAYGDNSRKVPIDEIIEAAKDAQIHSEFISKLPLGYDTPVGSRGDHLSGGQKQRIALARALIRKPKGEILLDGTDIKEINTAYLRSQISVVHQEPVLFSGTIAENIRFGNPQATQKEIEKAAKIANCNDFIEKLPKGYDTIVGENGAQLSGGQKQRIAIARAVIKNPKILLLDEATSAMDTQSERIIQKSLGNAMKGRTTLIISHRLSAIRNANQIVVVNQGEIVEKGTHEVLMNRKGIYYEFFIESQEDISQDLNGTSQKHYQSEEFINTVKPNDVSVRQVQRQEEKKVKQRILKVLFKDWKLLIGGCFTSVLIGSLIPLGGVILAEYLKAFETVNIDDIYNIATYCTVEYIALAVTIGCAALIQTYVFGKVAVRLSSLLRIRWFETAIRQELVWYDEQGNNAGALTARLSSDCDKVQRATGIQLSLILQMTSSAIVSIIIGLLMNWKLALLCSMIFPIIVIVGILESKYANINSVKKNETLENASKIAVEAIRNIRTVASFGQEHHFLQKFNQEIDIAEAELRNRTKYRGLVYSLNSTISFLCYGALFLYIGPLVTSGEVIFTNALMISESIFYGASMMAYVLNNLPNINQAIFSAINIMNFLDTIPNIPGSMSTASGNQRKDNLIFPTSIDYNCVKFRYPSRPEMEVLKGITFKVAERKTVALVGPSGSGKSTCVQLLLRFYDLLDGSLDFLR